MATFQAVVEIQYAQGSGGPGVNVWHYRTVEDVPGNALDNAEDRLNDFYNAIKAVYPTGTRIVFDGEWTPIAERDVS